jgi:Asp/Glu/hydantoin racemase
MIVTGGKPYYGEAIGILMFDNRRYPMIPGDVGNACSYDYPVRMKVVPGLDGVPYPPIREDDGSLTPDAQKCVAAAQEMEADGVRAIVMCCGFFTVIQDVLTDAVNIPVFTSPLMMIPQILRMLRKDRVICVITASKEALSRPFLEAAGVADSPRVVVAGLEGSKEFCATHMGGTEIHMNVDALRADVVSVAETATKENPNVGAFLMECTTLPSFSVDVQKATGLPVFDYIGYINMIYQSVAQRPYCGHL